MSNEEEVQNTPETQELATAPASEVIEDTTSEETTEEPQSPEPVEAPEEPEIEEPKKLIYEKKVTLPSGGEVIVKKLKSQRYYEAQKVYVKWISALQEVLRAQQMDVTKFVDADGKPDVTKIEQGLAETQDKALEAILTKSEEASQHRMELLSLCLDVSVEELGDKYYPEDISELMDAADEVNDFNSNLKKSVAPTSGKGA